jgi:septal ring factor EnvC (AmiA/AmiB activator)
MEQLRSRVRDANRDLRTVERLYSTSTSALRELDLQATLLNASVEETSLKRTTTEVMLMQRQVALNQRVRAIYKRGPLHSVRVLLSAESFGNLLARYKYLRMAALSERMLIEEVRRLEQQLIQQETEMRSNLAQLQILRDEKEREVERLARLENQHERTIRQYQQREKSAQGRLEELAKEEATVAGAIADLERRRRESESRAGGGRTEGTLTTRDLGALNWPVDGQLVFRFGPERKPNGVTLRYNGIGIAAAAGTPVKAVESGSVQIAGPLEGYGSSVVISHGAGSYTLYLRLRSVSVRVGQQVTAGQVIGAVGGEGTEHGAHLEFQVRVPSQGGAPNAVDPLNWLRARR